MRGLVDLLAAIVVAVRLAHRVRVGIDGPSAAGKTAVADALGSRLSELGRDVVRASIDDFHRPGHKFRSLRGEWTPQTYYDDLAFRDLVLRPCGPNGRRVCRPHLFDSLHDVPFQRRRSRLASMAFCSSTASSATIGAGRGLGRAYLAGRGRRDRAGAREGT